MREDERIVLDDSINFRAHDGNGQRNLIGKGGDEASCMVSVWIRAAEEETTSESPLSIAEFSNRLCYS